MSENEAAMDIMKKNTPEWSQGVLSQEMLRETRRRKADKERKIGKDTGIWTPFADLRWRLCSLPGRCSGMQ